MIHEVTKERIGWFRDIFLAAGLEEVDSEHSQPSNGEWRIFWSNKLLPIGQWPRPFVAGQRMNHFHSIGVVSTKANLAELAQEARQTHGQAHFDFFPESFLLPVEDPELRRLLERYKVLIQKPASGSKGEGISLVDRPEQVINNRFHVLQQYLEPPDLIRGRKYHVRVFIAITRLEPLRVFVHREGYIRLCNVPFQPTSSGHLESNIHVTNFVHDHDVTPGDTCYYSFAGFREILKSRCGII